MQHKSPDELLAALDLDRLNPLKLSAGMPVFVQVLLARTTPHVFEQFKAAVQVRPEIMQCHMAAGGFDYANLFCNPDLGNGGRRTALQPARRLGGLGWRPAAPAPAAMDSGLVRPVVCLACRRRYAGRGGAAGAESAVPWHPIEAPP